MTDHATRAARAIFVADHVEEIDMWGAIAGEDGDERSTTLCFESESDTGYWLTAIVIDAEGEAGGPQILSRDDAIVVCGYKWVTNAEDSVNDKYRYEAA